MKRSIIIKFIIFNIATFFISCNNDKSSLSEYKINDFYTLKLDDSLYLSDDVAEIISYNSNILIYDLKARHYLMHDFNNKKTHIFSYGKGPHEVVGVEAAAFCNDKIYAADIGKNNISVFDLEGRYLYYLNSPVKDVLRFNFAVDTCENIYISSYLEKKPIIKFNKDSIVKSFGEFLPFINEREKRAINYRRLLYSKNDRIISIYVSNPIIEVFSLDGNNLYSYDLSEYFEFHLARVKKKYNESPENRYVTWNLFRDACYEDGYIYLLYWGNYDIPNANQILVIKDNKNGLEIEKIINLDVKSASFSNICVSKGLLYAFDRASAEILIFKLQ